MDVVRKTEAQYSWSSQLGGAVSWWIVLSILIYSSLSTGAARPFPLFLTRLLIIAGIFFQTLFLFSKKNYFSRFPSFLIVPSALFIVFLMVPALQFFCGPGMIQTGFGTVNVYATFSSLSQLIFSFFFFVLCVQFAAREQSTEKFIFSISILVFGITLWGIAERFLGRALFRVANLQQDSFGPFVNPNHYSAFIALTLPLVWGKLMSLRGEVKEIPRKFHPFMFGKAALRLLDSGSFFFIFLTALAITGCFLSGSRAGALLIVISLAFQGMLFGGRRNLKLLGFAAGAILLVNLIVIQLVGWGETFRTFGLVSLRAAIVERVQVSMESLKIFFQYPLLGSGLGTYPFISPKFLTVLSNSVEWNHAHNDYVELLAETGILGFSLFFTALASLVLYGLRDRHVFNSHGIRTSSAFALFNIGVLELADFPLKIPSLALLFTLQLALLVCSHGQNADLKPLNRFVRSSLSAFFLLVAILLWVWATRDYQAHRFAQSKEDRVQNLEKALQLQPLNAEFWHELGWEYLKEKPGVLSEEGFKIKALEAFQKTVGLSPTYSRYWFSLGGVQYRLGYTGKAVESFEKAVAWAPYKSGYLLHLIAVYLEEGEKSQSLEGRNLKMRRVKELSVRLSSMKIFPSELDQKRWMGEAYAAKFRDYMLQWNFNRKAG